MFNRIDQGWSPIDYEGFKALRAEDNAWFTFAEDDNAWVVTASIDGLKLLCVIPKDSAEATAFETELKPYGNRPIQCEEVRFYTHDFCDPADWDGRTLGIQAAWVPGAVVYDYLSCQWKNAQGEVVAWLDMSSFPSVWRDAAGNVIVSYRPSDETWRRTDNGADVTNTRWRVLPPPGYKIQMLEAWSQADIGAAMQPGGALHYEAYSYVPAGHPLLPPSAPGGIYKVKDWLYDSMATLRAGADGLPYVEPLTLPGHTGPVVTMGYTYSKTKPQMLDSRYGQYMDIVLDGHKKIVNSKEAKGMFIGLKWASF